MKKDGPNKGREFYLCPKQPPCQFFEWADGPALNTSGGASTSGSNNRNPPPRNYGNNANDQGQGKKKRMMHTFSYISHFKLVNLHEFILLAFPARKRKCGNCKQEGHIRTKCPRLNLG